MSAAASPHVVTPRLVLLHKDVPGADAGAISRWLRQFAVWFGRYHASVRNALPRDTPEDGPGLWEAVRAIKWDEIDRAALASWRTEARGVMQQGSARSGMQLRWDLVSPAAEKWMREHGAELVTGVSAETRAAIRTAVAEGLKGSTVRETARALRSVVGVNDVQAGAVMRYRQTLLEAGVPPDAVARKVDQMGARFIRERADTIARTETMTALNAGKRATWSEAKKRGLLTEKAKREWLAGDGCPRCEAFAGAKADIDGEYTSTSGETSQGPTLHPRCGCTERVRPEG